MITTLPTPVADRVCTPQPRGQDYRSACLDRADSLTLQSLPTKVLLRVLAKILRCHVHRSGPPKRRSTLCSACNAGGNLRSYAGTITRQSLHDSSVSFREIPSRQRKVVVAAGQRPKASHSSSYRTHRALALRAWLPPALALLLSADLGHSKGRYAHATQFKRHHRQLRTRLGRLLRDIRSHAFRAALLTADNVADFVHFAAPLGRILAFWRSPVHS